MWFVFSEIVLWMVASFGLGLLAGFAVWRWRRGSLRERRVLQADLDVTSANLADTLQRRDQLEQLTSDLDAQVEANRAQIEGLVSERSRLAAALTDLRAVHEVKVAELATIQRAHDQLIDAKSSLEFELDATRTERESLAAAVAESADARRMAEAGREELRRELEQARCAHAALDRERSDEIDELTKVIADLHAERDGLIDVLQANRTESAPRSLSAPPIMDLREPPHARTGTESALGQAARHRADPPSTFDDLKRIVGIGPVLERLLHANGIYFFAQLAALSETEIDILQAQLPGFPNRIRHDDWRSQANVLQHSTPSGIGRTPVTSGA